MPINTDLNALKQGEEIDCDWQTEIGPLCILFSKTIPYVVISVQSKTSNFQINFSLTAL